MKSRRIRYGLKTFLVTLTIVAVMAGYYGNKWNRARLQVKAIEAISIAGGLMEKDKEKNPTRVMFRGNVFDDKALEEIAPHLKNLPELKELDFVQANITDKGLEFLLNVKQIDELYLFETGVTQNGINELSDLMPQLAIKTEKPEPISSGMAMMNIYSHAMVALDWTPDGSYLATGSADGIIRLWDFETNSPMDQWQAHEDWTFSVAFSPNGKVIATGGGDNLVKLWDSESLKLIAELAGHTDDVHSVAFTTDGKMLVSSGDDSEIRFWNLETRETVKLLAGHDAQIPSIAIGPNGKFVASASRDNTVRIWDIASGQSVATFSTDDNDVNSVAFDSKGEFLASGDQGGKIMIWNIQSKTLVKQLEGHNGKVYRIAFDQESDLLASCGDDGIRMWTLSTGVNHLLGRSQQYVSSVAFHPTDDVLASTNAGGELHLMDIDRRKTLRILRTSYGERGFDFIE
jgi:WD40 repeat protein/predicted transcriptional regulator